MNLAALALIQVPVLTPREQEVTVIGRRLNAMRAHWRSDERGARCVIDRSSGDRAVDALACTAITDCSVVAQPQVLAIARDRTLSAAARRAAMAPVNAEMGRCLQTRHDALVTALADRRAAAREAAGS